MDPDRLRALLTPYAPGLSAAQLEQLQQYLALLLKWNARINLTAVRSPEDIVTRHFGESLFAAQALTRSAGVPPAVARASSPAPLETRDSRLETAVDLGSGAGFPGLPLKLYCPALHVTLVESQHKKATFLREVIRALGLTGIEVLTQRAEQLTLEVALVTLRAVERFEAALPVAARLLAPAGRLALLIGAAQAATARRLLPTLSPADPVPIPGSRERILLVLSKLET